MSECTHDCSTCSSKCEKADFQQPLNVNSSVANVIAVASGKGGVGKSLVTSLLACESVARGNKVAVMDADITGPSIPKAFGLHEQAVGTELGIEPAVAENGVKVMSINLILDDEEKPVVWRGPVISGVIQQFWSDVNWGELDYLFVDMPPGTGDVALTVFQSLPVDGIVIVSTPQDLVKMIVNKAFNMAQMMNVKVLGLVENMSYFECPDCGKKISIFGESQIDETAKELGVPVLAKLPINPDTAKMVDAGDVEGVECKELDEFIEALK